MSIVAWIILGLVSGFIASMLVNRSGEGVIMDTLLGVGGAVIGGFLFHLIGSVGVTGVNPWSVLVSVVGAVFVLSVSHAIRRSTTRTA